MVTRIEKFIEREAARKENRRYWSFVIIVCIILVLATAGFLAGYYWFDGLHLHTTVKKVTYVQYPQVTKIIENNITNTEIVEKTTYAVPEYEQDCVELIKEDGTKYIYCPN